MIVASARSRRSDRERCWSGYPGSGAPPWRNRGLSCSRASVGSSAARRKPVATSILIARECSWLRTPIEQLSRRDLLAQEPVERLVPIERLDHVIAIFPAALADLIALRLHRRGRWYPRSPPGPASSVPSVRRNEGEARAGRSLWWKASAERSARKRINASGSGGIPKVEVGAADQNGFRSRAGSGETLASSFDSRNESTGLG